MKRYIIIALIALLSGHFTSVLAQGLVVSGKVLDESNAPLPGVAVMERGVRNGVVTEADGTFKIAVENAKSVLEFSCLGYLPKEITVGDRRSVIVTLIEDAIGLEEVVVVGYGNQKKASVVGSISTTEGKDIQKIQTTNLTQAIGGKIAGVVTKSTGGRPGDDDASVYIRGRASYNSAANSPLVLVDGVERDFSQIDPEDIESFSVLKDASATAVFGVRGANGVILVTTKRGETAIKPTVDFRASIASNSPTMLPKKLGAYDHARLKNEALANVGQVPEYSADDLNHYLLGDSPYTHPDNDYIGDMLKKNTLKQQYNLVVRGGSPFLSYYVSVNYLNEDGIYKQFDNDDYDTNVSFKRYGLRSNLDFNITKTTKLGVDLSGRLEERHNNGYGDGLYQALIRTPADCFNYVNPDGSLGGNLNMVNPYAALSHYGYDHSKRNVFEAAVKLTQKLDAITKGLSVRAMYSFVSTFASRRDLEEKPELWKYNADGTYTPIQKATSISIATSAGPHTRRMTTEIGLNYDRTFNNKHNVTAMLAFNNLVYRYNANLATGYINYVGRVTYAYKHKYLLEFNAGYNGSRQFAEGKRYGFFPAYSAGWVLSEEKFWKNKDIFSYLKIRGSYGELGNDVIGSSKYLYYQVYPMYTSDRASFGENNNPENRILEGTEGNSEVTWERSRKSNVGFDAKLFKKRLSLTMDFFREHRVDILDYDRSRSLIYGMLDADNGTKGFPPENLGEVVNRGFEIELGWDHKVGPVSYYAKGTFSLARNKIVKIGETPVTYQWSSQVGRPVGQRYGLICDGFYNSYEEIEALPSGFTSNLKLGDLKYRDVNGDGVTDQYDIVPIGKTQLPEIFYGFTIGAEWKGIDLQVFFQGAAESDIYVNGYGFWEFTSQSSVMEHHLGRWTEDNKENATYPSLSPAKSDQNHRLSTFWLKDGSYLRLKNAQIGYTLPKSLTMKVKMQAVRFYIGGTNLLTFSSFKIYDPESSDGDGSRYPLMRQFNAGVNIKF
ncbi:MAG: TonB-dependent receptor [Bacteroidales bacterium]|nr:TonB-dependent receptor [Bacteroidales bacterium]